MRIPLPSKVTDVLALTTSVLAKHVADGANSPLINFVDTNALSAKLPIAQAAEAQRASLFVQAKQHTEARDRALGLHPTQTSATPNTALFEVHKTLSIVQGAFRDSYNTWGLWGFDVKTSSRIVWKSAAGKIVKAGTAGAIAHHTKPAPRVAIPENALELITLGKAIVAKHIADGANSPLTNFVDTATLAAKLQTAETEHLLSLQVHRDAETARAKRDIAIWGSDTTHTATVAGSIIRELTKAQKGLSVIFSDDLHRLGDWGFTVNAAASHTTPATPPTPTPPNGGGGNNPNNPN